MSTGGAALESSRSNLTRLADRLEAAGLIGREDSPEDRRGCCCVITRPGRAMRKKMWPAYEAQIAWLFSRHVTLEEARAIGEALARVVKTLREEKV